MSIDVDEVKKIARLACLSVKDEDIQSYATNLSNILDMVEQMNAVDTSGVTPMSHPFVERLIGTLRREYLDHVFFWNARDLERKLEEFRDYYNCHRVHTSLDGDTPAEVSGKALINRADPHQFRWQTHCRGLFQLPMAA